MRLGNFREQQSGKDLLAQIYSVFVNSNKPYLLFDEVLKDVDVDGEQLVEALSCLEKEGYIHFRYVFEDEDGSFIGQPTPINELPEYVTDQFLHQRKTKHMRPQAVFVA